MSRAGIYVSFRLAIGNVLRESKWECSLVGNVPEKYNMVFSFLKFDLLEMLLGYAIWYSSVKMWSIPWELNEDGTVWEAIFSYYLNSFTSSNEYCSIEETTHFLWETLSLIYIDWDGGYLPSVRYPQSVRCLANIRHLSDIRWISFCHLTFPGNIPREFNLRHCGADSLRCGKDKRHTHILSALISAAPNEIIHKPCKIRKSITCPVYLW